MCMIKVHMAHALSVAKNLCRGPGFVWSRPRRAESHRLRED